MRTPVRLISANQRSEASIKNISGYDWMFSTKDNGNVSGAVTITPTNGSRQKAAVTGNVTGLTCDLSATYPYVILSITTDGAYTLDLMGWETDGGEAITLPDTGKCILTLMLDADGTTKYALLSATDIA